MNRLISLSIVLTAYFFFGCLSLSASLVDDYSALTDSTKLDGKIYNVAEEAPRFPGCSDIADKLERDECARINMLKFIYGNVKYPPEARSNGVQGMTAIKFVVANDGTLHNFEIVRSIGGGCDEEALRVIKSMPKWEPGIFKGEAVHTNYTVPIKFKLEDTYSKEEKERKKKSRKNRN